VSTSTARASFLDDPETTEAVAHLYEADLSGQGYVAHLTRLWAHSPESLHLLGQSLGLAAHLGGIGARERSLLVTAASSAVGSSYCALAWGTKLAVGTTDAEAAAVIAGKTLTTAPGDAALVAWARRVSVAPTGTTEADVEELRALGYDDRQVFAITVYVALRLAFSMVNDALGAAPDLDLVERAPAAVRGAVDFGRMPVS
jgi:alkylhydroperoxidase family enzyme